jgi:hypothetical protein
MKQFREVNKVKKYRYLQLIDPEAIEAHTESFLKSYSGLHKIESEDALAHMEKTIENIGADRLVMATGNDDTRISFIMPKKIIIMKTSYPENDKEEGLVKPLTKAEYHELLEG